MDEAEDPVHTHQTEGAYRPDVALEADRPIGLLQVTINEERRGLSTKIKVNMSLMDAIRAEKIIEARCNCASFILDVPADLRCSFLTFPEIPIFFEDLNICKAAEPGSSSRASRGIDLTFSLQMSKSSLRTNKKKATNFVSLNTGDYILLYQ